MCMEMLLCHVRIPRAHERHKRFNKAVMKSKTKDGVRCPHFSKTDDNISIINDIVRNDRQLSTKTITETVYIDTETNSHDQLNMKNVCA